MCQGNNIRSICCEHKEDSTKRFGVFLKLNYCKIPRFDCLKQFYLQEQRRTQFRLIYVFRHVEFLLFRWYLKCYDCGPLPLRRYLNISRNHIICHWRCSFRQSPVKDWLMPYTIIILICLLFPGTWSHFWFAGVRKCPLWCSIVGATVTVHQFFCILHCCDVLDTVTVYINRCL